MIRQKLRDWFLWTYQGVDNNLSGNGGEDCINFLSPTQRVIETLIFASIALWCLCWAWSHVKTPDNVPHTKNFDNAGKRFLLMLHVFVFGIEIGFKFATRQMIWVLNPCHLVTMMQIYLLIAPPSKSTMTIYRCMIHCLQGATIALLFPVINTRLLMFETETYYIQHILMLVIPIYLMHMGGIYTPEPILDYSYALLAAGILFFYHWTFLQYLAYETHVNLNNMMCPAVSDPFYGPWYRVWAFGHQTALMLIHGKVYTLLVKAVCPPVPPSVQSNNTHIYHAPESNGHAKIH